MFQKFYGLTALNLLMVGMPIKLYVECIDNLKNDKETLVLLREQFNSIGNFLDSIPSEYKDREAKRAFGKLNRLLKTEPNSPEIAELTNFLSKQEVYIAHFVDIGSGENMRRVELSEVSIAILSYLKNKKEDLERYKKFLIINSEIEKEVYFFNQPLYRLRNFSRARLLRLINTATKTYSVKGQPTEQFWDFVKKFTDFIFEHVSDEEDDKADNLSEPILSDIDSFISQLDYKYFNLMLGVDFTLEQYHQASLELYEIGLIGFTPFINEMYKEFQTSFSPSYNSDLHVSKSSDIYGFCLDLRRALDSNLMIGQNLRG